MSKQIRQKWRPPLALVIGGTLAVILCLPVIGIGYLRLAGGILGWLETAQLFGLVAAIATLILGFLLWRLVLRPVYALTAHADALKNGRDDTPLPDHFGTPEFSALGRAMQDMATTLQDREAGLRAYTDHVTHELKSPLTSLIGAAELLEGDVDAEDRAQLATTIKQSSQKMDELLKALRRLAAAREPVGRGPVQVAEVVAALSGNIEIELAGDSEVPIDRESLHAVLTHLVQNAAAHGAGKVMITCEERSLRVSDDGPGIAPGNRERIFDPYFTTRREAGGTGMGLAIVRTMLRTVGGDVELVPCQKGAAFRLRFPE
ncbi:ATP-binding protein [Roseovarius sp. EL26]|uniref:ATP-binding protein n=1 Tax=Roseovarius sp. EL26 TaxID=2126672 RepID=UPI000EA2AC9F|nr:ATP-binding protein [Roseovarius sp. EL26]